eukprot:TRINITY_DN1352_c0_g1_i2.p2 TRINITY_DN1352_c0_g1~~TRINITY_DN1352_c0_g1_i2.p2  ORF type:complete len:258 (-),score=107.34 TRINITY_DN1352_c0_g1_i2:20-793(-)
MCRRLLRSSPDAAIPSSPSPSPSSSLPSSQISFADVSFTRSAAQKLFTMAWLRTLRLEEKGSEKWLIATINSAFSFFQLSREREGKNHLYAAIFRIYRALSHLEEAEKKGEQRVEGLYFSLKKFLGTLYYSLATFENLGEVTEAKGEEVGKEFQRWREDLSHLPLPPLEKEEEEFQQQLQQITKEDWIEKSLEELKPCLEFYYGSFAKQRDSQVAAHLMQIFSHLNALYSIRTKGTKEENAKESAKMKELAKVIQVC